MTRPRQQPYAVVATAYLSRVAQLLTDWLLLTGDAGDPVAPFHWLTAALDPLPSPKVWPQYSTLGADGAPLELCETLTHRSVGPTYTCDPGPYGAPPPVRLERAVRMATDLLASINGADEMIRTVRTRLFPAHVVLEPFTLWLGVAHAASGTVRIKLYWNLCWRGTRDGWQRMLATLDSLGCRPCGTAARILAALADRGYPKQLALTIRPAGQVEAKLYYRLAYIDLALLAQLAALGGLRAEPFEAYVGLLLRRGHDRADHRAGIGVALDAAGEVEALGLYHYVWPYFADDGALRRRLLTVGPAWDWDLTLYRSASRLIDGGCCRCRRLLGFAVQRAGATGLHIYASTGHLA